jgi:hypothetical protein
MPNPDFEIFNEDALALTAAIGTRDNALLAWTRLMELMHFDEINSNTQRIAPTIFLNLKGTREFKERERLRGSYKYTWAKTTRLIHSIEPILRKFDAVDLDYRIIKGLAIQVSLNHVGSRIMGDVDVLIGLNDVDRATDIVRSFGFRNDEVVHCDGHTLSSHYGGLNFSLGETHLDFHVAETKYPEHLLTAMIEEPATSASFGSFKMKIPSCEMLFLHAIVHGKLSSGPTDFIQAVCDIGQLQERIKMSEVSRIAELTHLNGVVFAFIKSCSKHGLTDLGIKLPAVGRSSRHRFKTFMNQHTQDLNSNTLLDRIRARRFGRAIAVDIENQNLISRMLYRIWLFTGQIAALETVFRAIFGGMLTKPSAHIWDGMVIRPFQIGESGIPLKILKTAGQTIDWRFRCLVPVNVRKLIIEVRAEPLNRVDIYAFANGKILSRLIGGDSTTHVLTFDKPSQDIEISLRPIWLACKQCFAGFNEMELAFTLVSDPVGS